MSNYKISEFPQDKYRFALYDNVRRLTWQQIKAETGCCALVNLWYFGLANFSHQAAVMLDGKWTCRPNWDWPGICVDKEGYVTTGWINDATWGYAASVQADYIAGKRTNTKAWGRNGVTYTGLKADGTVVLMLASKNSGLTSAESVKIMQDAGCVDILRWDGSWSSQGSLGPGMDVQPSQKRICRGWLLVYPKENKKEDKPVDNGNLREAVVNAARGELGTKGGTKYVGWYNQTTGSTLASSAAWCAIFASWCARKAGIPADKLPNYAGCTTAMKTFKRLGTWRPRNGYTPSRGDLIFFDHNADTYNSEHTGIVTGVSGGYVKTIEGNSGSAPGSVREKSYALAWAGILGYVTWDGTGALTPIQTAQKELNARYVAGLDVDGSWGPASRKAFVRALQTEINRIYKAKLAVDGSFGPASRAACPNLRRGNKNNLVRLLQLGLQVKGYALDVDGSFGAGTERTVIAFQADTKQKANGVAGKNTFTALVK